MLEVLNSRRSFRVSDRLDFCKSIAVRFKCFRVREDRKQEERLG